MKSSTHNQVFERADSAWTLSSTNYRSDVGRTGWSLPGPHLFDDANSSKTFATLCRTFSSAAPGIPFEVELPEGATLADLVSQLNLPVRSEGLFCRGARRPADWPLEQGMKWAFSR